MFPIKDDQPRYSTPYVNGFLIGINILIYLFQATLNPRAYEQFARQFGMVPNHLALFLSGSPKYSFAEAFLPFFTSMFLHAGWMHVLGNMWFLYIFGDNIEDYLGHFKYLGFYLLSGLFAMATQVVIYPHSNMPTVGASGAIAGVLGAYFILYPTGASADLVFRICALPAGVDHAGRVVRAPVLRRAPRRCRWLRPARMWAEWRCGRTSGDSCRGW